MRIDTHSAFEGSIFSLSLAGPCIMEFRKYTDIDWISKSTSLDKEVENSDSSSSFLRRAIYLPPRSILLLSGEARYAWHHYIPHHKEQSRRKLVTRIEYEKFLQITSRVMVKEPQNMHSGDIQPTGNISKFPRSNVWDPYKRLEITTDASEEEVWSSRNFLLDQYAGHERSVESIEAAFEKILMTSFLNRKKTKINLKSRLKKQVEESPPWVKNLISFIELPPNVIIVRRLFLFAFMACWSVNSSAEGGPAFQVALSLMACIYFLYDKTKSLARASFIGLGSLVVGWICGSCLVPMIPSVLLQPTWTLELLTSLVAYIFLFAGCTFLK